MLWEDERYVRLYTRDTAEWACWCWQAKALFPLLLRKLDRSGVLATRLGARGIAALTGLPLEVVEPGIKDLLGDGCITEHQLGYCAPNFLAAQEALSSGAKRQRESRERRRLGLSQTSVSKSTYGHEECDKVTGNVTPSQVVTPSLAVPIRSEPCLTETEIVGGDLLAQGPISIMGKRKPGHATQDEREKASRSLSKLSERNGIKYQGGAVHVQLIASQLRSGVTEGEMRAIVAMQAEKWGRDPMMLGYLRPETLFGPRAIAKYLDEARTRYAEQIQAVDQPAQPMLQVAR